jgi:phytol kinase
MGLLSRVKSKSPLGNELKRKSLHIGVGLTALSFPIFLTDVWMVLGAVALVLTWMAAVRLLPPLQRRFGRVLHDTGRKSFGEVYFGFAIACLLLLPQPNPAHYAIPLLILTFADSAAAIVGGVWPVGRLRGLTSGKTFLGCLVFAITAFVITFALLNLFTAMGTARVVAVSLITATLSAYTEAVSPRGFDNLTVPGIAWLVLYSTIGGV